MPRDSAGVMTLPPTTWATTGQTISVNQHNPAMREIEAALTESLPRNGSAGLTGNFNANGFRITNLADPINNGDAVSLGFARNATPVGMVIDFAGDFAPDGWILCDGRSLSRTTEAALFAVIGTKFGSSSGSTFNVPDLRGRVVAGIDNMGGTSAGRITNAESGFNPNSAGSSGGVQSVKLTVDQMPSHNHGGNTNSTGSHRHTTTVDSAGVGGGDVPTVPRWNALARSNYGGLSAQSSTDGNHSHTIQSQGGGKSHPNMQPTMVMNKIIRAR